MKRIRYWIMQLSIRKKLVFYSYLIITPILLLISVLLFYQNYEKAMESEETNCLQSVQSLGDGIEAMQQSVMEIGTYICINDDIGRILKSGMPEALNQDSLLWMHSGPMRMIQDMIAINGQIKTLAIYPENGVRPYLSCMDSASYQGDIREVRRQEIYAKAAEQKGKLLWRRVGKGSSDTYQFNYKDKIVMYRQIYDLSRKNKLGYLVIGSSAEKFDEICQNSLRDEKEEIVVMSRDGSELVRCGGMKDKKVSDILAKELEKGETETLTASRENSGYAVYRCGNDATGTVVYKLVPKLKLSNLLETTIYTPLALLLGFLVGLYPIMVLVSNIVSKPLHALCIAMEKFKQGDFTQKVEVSTLDEVGEASACFNLMVDDMRGLIDRNYVMALKERESELDLLQAQINPHFLYNTLDTLYWRTIEAGEEKIGEDILALSQMFRLVLGRGNGIVPVQSEAELLERYLQIQQMRFGRRLEYKILVSQEIREELIPKLILQPFVENAVVHGFEQGGANYYLEITGKSDGHYMEFRIHDTGVGMTPEQMDAIWEETESRKYASQRIGRYAIKNIKERLELTYFEDYELRIESEKGSGTTVIIRIPCGLKEAGLHEHKTTDCG